ncbi:MAG: hypothetical protein Q8N99_06940 [Nanoarchaeota archaeon]|nr:hypothetical protein [Nanoarchaeota archaeon]
MKRGKKKIQISSINKNLFSNNRNAQVAVFVIVAVLIVVVFLFIFIFKTGKNDCGSNPLCMIGIKPEIDSLKASVYTCQEEVTTEALKVIGIQGGFYKKPKYYKDIDSYFIPYYYYSQEFLIPQKITVENELSSYVDENIMTCLGKMKSNNYNIEFAIPKTRTVVTNGRTTFTTEMLIVFKTEKTSEILDLKELPISYNSSLYYILEVADYITRTHKSDNQYMICINCVVDMAKERNLYVDMMEYPGLPYTTLVMISENYTSTEPYIFEFLNKY